MIPPSAVWCHPPLRAVLPLPCSRGLANGHRSAGRACGRTLTPDGVRGRSEFETAFDHETQLLASADWEGSPERLEQILQELPPGGVRAGAPAVTASQTPRMAPCAPRRFRGP